MWSEGDALAYSNPTVLGRGAYGVAMAVTTPDAKRIAVKLIPKRTNFASTSDGRIAFAARELDVIDKMKAADARHVIADAVRQGRVAHHGRGAFIHPRGLEVARLCEIIRQTLAQGAARAVPRLG